MYRTSPSQPFALLALACALAMSTASVFAHGDEDHSQDKKPAATSAAAASSTATPGTMGAPTAAQRLPDGSLFVPKEVQRQLGIRTVLAQVTDLPATLELNGRVVADPNAGGRVQASQGGRIEAGPKGVPLLVSNDLSLCISCEDFMRFEPWLG